MSSQANRADDNDLLELISLHSTNKSEKSQSIDQQNKSACEEFDAFHDQREFNVLEISSNESDDQGHSDSATKQNLIAQERVNKPQKHCGQKENEKQKLEMFSMECQQIQIDECNQQSELLNSREPDKNDSHYGENKILQSEYVTVLESQENMVQFGEASEMPKIFNNTNQSIPQTKREDEQIIIKQQTQKMQEEHNKFTKAIVIVIFLLILLQCARYFSQATESIIKQISSQMQNLFFLLLGCCLVGGIILQRKMQKKMKERV